MARPAGGLPDLLGARIDGDRRHLGLRGRGVGIALAEQVPHGQLLEFEGAEQLALAGLVECPGLTGVTHQLAQRIGVLPGRDLVPRVHTELVQDRVGGVVEQEQQRAGEPEEPAHRQRQQGGRVLRVRDGPRLGRHLAHDQVQERDDDQREDERDDVRRPQGQAPAGEHRREPVVHGRLGDRTQGQRTQGDAELCARQQQGQLGGVPQRGARGDAGGGRVLETVAARGDQ